MSFQRRKRMRSMKTVGVVPVMFLLLLGMGVMLFNLHINYRNLKQAYENSPQIVAVDWSEFVRIDSFKDEAEQEKYFAYAKDYVKKLSEHNIYVIDARYLSAAPKESLIGLNRIRDLYEDKH